MDKKDAVATGLCQKPNRTRYAGLRFGSEEQQSECAISFCNETKKLVASDTTLATSGTAEGIRTPDLLVRSQTLYPAELLAHTRSIFFRCRRFALSLSLTALL